MRRRFTPAFALLRRAAPVWLLAAAALSVAAYLCLDRGGGHFPLTVRVIGGDVLFLRTPPDAARYDDVSMLLSYLHARLAFGQGVSADVRLPGGVHYFEVARTGTVLRVPLAYPTVATLAGLTWGVARLRRRHYRAHSGLCQRCGYDLRYSPKRCPECGSVSGSEEPDNGPGAGQAESRITGKVQL